mgnify:CR=1 FL=1
MKKIFLAIFAIALTTACSSDDGESTAVGGDHSYNIDITSGFFDRGV